MAVEPKDKVVTGEALKHYHQNYVAPGAIHELSFTGTTSANGNVGVPTLTLTEHILLGALCTSANVNNVVLLPYNGNNNAHAIHAVDVSANTNAVANASLGITVYYMTK